MAYTTLSELRTDVRSRIAEPAARYCSDEEINRWINLGYHDYAASVQPCKTWLAYTIPVALKATFNLPNNSFGIERINWAEQWPLLHCTEMEFRQRLWTAPGATAVRPNMYMDNPIGGTGNAKQFEIWQPPNTPSVSVLLNANISSSATTIVSSTAIPTGGNGWTAGSFPNNRGFFFIGSEQIRYWGIDTDTNSFLNCERGTGNTTAASHLAGAAITYAPLQVLYRFDPDSLVNDSDPIMFSQFSWHEALVCYAAFQCFTKKREMQLAQSQMQNYIRIRDEARLVRERETLDRPRKFLAADPAEMGFWW